MEIVYGYGTGVNKVIGIPLYPRHRAGGAIGTRGAWGNPRRPEGVGARSESAPHPNYHSSLT